jgi:hypothetical protein
MTTRQPKDIVLDFNASVNKLIKYVSMRVNSPSDEEKLDRIKKRIELYKSYSGRDALLKMSGKYLLHYATDIKNKNIQFLFDMDPEKECEKLQTKIEANDAHILELFKNIRESCEQMSEKEKKLVMDDIYNLYSCYIEFIVAS